MANEDNALHSVNVEVTDYVRHLLGGGNIKVHRT